MPNTPERAHGDVRDNQADDESTTFEIELDSTDDIEPKEIDSTPTALSPKEDNVDEKASDLASSDSLFNDLASSDLVSNNSASINSEANGSKTGDMVDNEVLSTVIEPSVIDTIEPKAEPKTIIDNKTIADNTVIDSTIIDSTVTDNAANKVIVDAAPESADKSTDDTTDTINNIDNRVAENLTASPTDTLTETPIEIIHETLSAADRKDAPRAVHVTTGSSMTPKGRLNQAPKITQNGRHAFVWYALAFLVLIVDQWTKWLAETTLTFHEPVPVIEPVLNWTLAYNYGAAFSFLADAGGWQKWFFAGLALVMSLFLIGYLIKAPRQARLLSIGLGLVLGGAVGNLIDRLLHGHVIDFIHVHYADKWHYPIFNIADMGICIGVALIIIDMIFLEKKRHV